PSGQSVILSRLLSDVPADAYCLITLKGHAATAHTDAGDTLNAPCHWLTPAPARRWPSLPILRQAGTMLNVRTAIEERARQIRRIVAQQQAKLLIACTG